jgi:O-antigen ligase/tetratricopeptide (TPR) repeat protein
MKAPHPPLHVGMAERARNKKIALMKTSSITHTKFTQFASFGMAFTGFVLAVLYGGIIWRDEPAVQIAGWVFAAIGLLGSAAWYFRSRTLRILRTPLDWIAAGLVIVLLLSWLFSPSYRQGLGRLFLFLALVWLFYFMLAAFQAGLDRRSVLLALLSVSGVVVVFAGLETYLVYFNWFQRVGSYQVLPPFPYRLMSLLGHANPYMAFANLFAPLAAVGFFKSTNRLLKIGAGVWLGFYLVALPFSSSRGGWLAFAVWAALLVGKWLVDAGYQRRLWALVRRRPLLSIAGSASILLAASLALYRFFMLFTNHPTHSPNLLGSRSFMWVNAIEIWQKSPWIGAGIGRFSMEYMAVEAVPPGFWAVQAHSIFFQALAETGLAGLLVLLLLIGFGIGWMWQRYRCTTARWQPYSWAILSAVAAFLFACLVDDYSAYPAIMIPLVVLLAWQLSAGSTPLSPRPSWLTGLAGMMGLLLLAGSAWSMWAYLPAYQAINGDHTPRSTSQLLDESIRRDPQHALYHQQAGLAWAADWEARGDEQSLQRARTALANATAIEPSPALWWANLAVLDWYAGDRDAAQQHLQQALSLSATEPSFHLLRGWFNEQGGLKSQALQDFQQALALAPAWVDHPFWQLTESRRVAAQAARHPMKISSSVLPDNFQIAAAEWANLGYTADLLTIRAAVTDDGAVLQASKAILNRAASKLVTSGYGFYSIYTIFGFDLVPGYLQLEENVGQFAVLENLYGRYLQSGDCQQAAHTWIVLHRLQAGGSLEGIPQMPLCQVDASQP